MKISDWVRKKLRSYRKDKIKSAEPASEEKELIDIEGMGRKVHVV